MDVICIDGKFSEEAKAVYRKYGIVWPEEDKMYSIRDVIRTTTGETGLLLNEIINPKMPIVHPILGKIEYEPNWNISRFSTLLGDKLTREELSEFFKETVKIKNL